jgi:hypothetical protein
MRAGGFIGVATLVVIGWIAADVLTHPTGAAVGFNGITNLVKISAQGATGQKVS